jgi:hypothetical protein
MIAFSNIGGVTSCSRLSGSIPPLSSLTNPRSVDLMTGGFFAPVSRRLQAPELNNR